MQITQAELGLITNPRIHRRMMRIPLERGSLGELKKCPVRPGALHNFRAGKGSVMVTVMEVRREKLAAWSAADAKREGYAGVQGALDAWRRQHGPPAPGEEAWVVSFELGDQTPRFDEPLLMARRGDYTFTSSLSVPGEGEVLLPFAKDLAAAKARARERRVSPQASALKRQAAEAESLQESITNMKARALVKRAQRNFEAATRLLLSEQGVSSRVGAAADGSHGEADRPLGQPGLATPEAA